MIDGLVSVVIPIYNVEHYLDKCIESVAKQTYGKIEIILVNDGSNDNSDQIMNDWEKRDDRVKCFYKENGGLSDARNYGLKQSSGEFVMFVDSDDFIELDTIELMINSIYDNNSDISVCDMKYIYDDRVTFATGGDFKCESFTDNKNIIFINNSACNKLYKKSLFDDIEFPVGMWYEDLATIPILLSKAKSVSKVNKSLYCYVQRGGSIAHTITDKVFDIYKAINIIDNYCKNDNLGEEIKKLYIHHGLFLTTLRIKDSADDIEKYLMKNNQMLDRYFPEWRKIKKFEGYNIKNKIIFNLLQHNHYYIVKLLYRRNYKK